MMRALLLLLLAWMTTPVWAAEPVPLSGDRIDLTGKMDWLQDREHRITSADFRGNARSATDTRFTPLPSELNAGYLDYPIWLRVDLAQQPGGPREWLLQLSNPLTDEIDVYLPQADGTLLDKHGGESRPRSEWEVFARTPVFHLDLPAGTQRVYVRLAGRNAMYTSLTLWQPESFHAMNSREAQLYGLYYGMLLLLLVFQLLFWLRSRSVSAFWYLVYLGITILGSMLIVGFLQYNVVIDNNISDRLNGLVTCFGAPIYARFMLLQFGIRQHQPKLAWIFDRVLWTVSVFYAALILGDHFGLGIRAVQITSMLLLAFLVVDTTWLIHRGHKLDRTLLVAFWLIGIAVCLRYARLLGLPLEETTTESVYHFGLSVHLLLLSILVGNRDRQLSAEKEQAQAATIETVRQLNATLESKVAARTEDLRRALAVEQQAREDQRGFVAMVSHEFRTPLAIIDTTLQQLENNPAAPAEKTKTRLTNASGAVARMVALMEKYLSQDRLDSTELALKASSIDLGELLRSVVAEWPPQRIKLTTEELPPDFVCDPHLLTIALRNLLANAERHCPAGEIALHAAPDADGSVCIGVTDHGEGIAQDEMEHLFRKYFRGAAAQGKPGAGLGLYLVQRIARLHGGSIAVASTPGQGSAFSLRLPTGGGGGDRRASKAG